MHLLRRNFTIPVFKFVLLSFLLLASQVSFASQRYSQAVIEYGNMIKENLYKETKENSDNSKDKKLERLVGFIAKEMDLNKISKRVLGSYFKELSEEDKEKYLQEFRVFLFNDLKVNSGVALLVPYKNVKMRKHPVHVSNRNFDIIYDIADAPIEGFNETADIILILSVTISEDLKDCKITNISVNNIDIISSQRRLFRSYIDENGLSSIFELMED
ncbi:MAG: ABC transporter substrate-binding protein [Alphaproteobacteria bacterium]|nr:ABC transporter substrate-binding protein [Rickettsiales bacterium]